MRDLQQVVNEGGTLNDVEILGYTKTALFGIINPEASLLASIDACVDGATRLVPDPRLKKSRQSVNASLLNIFNQIKKMMEVIEELENAVHKQGSSDPGVGEDRNGSG